MNGEVDPYASPAVDPTGPLPESREEGKLWRVEADRVLVRDGAVLPDVCMLSGFEGGRGFRWVTTHVHGGAVRITVFQTWRAYLKRGMRVFSGAVLGPAAGVGSSFLMLGDGSATPLSISVSLVLIGIGGLFSMWQASRGPSIRSAGGGWHEFHGIHPAAVARLREIRETKEPNQELDAPIHVS